MAKAAAYYGGRQACLLSDKTHVIWAGRSDIPPIEVVGILMTTHWSCVGQYDAAALPPVSYIALIALRRGMLNEAPRATWPRGRRLDRRPLLGHLF